MPPLTDVLQPPLLTSDLPGVGGKIKATPEDFEVEEIPAYEPSGQGDFVYLWIEKRDMGAEYFERQIARRLDIPVGEIGTAGLKDRRAVTRQMVSVPAFAEPRLAALDGDGIKVLRVSRHSNKLRSGHLHGNRFRILIRTEGQSRDGEAPAEPEPVETFGLMQPLARREPRPPAAASAFNAIIDRLRQHGMPNYYGPQRFGREGETLHMGIALLRGGQGPRSPFLRKLALSAGQSALFNHALAQRFRDGLLRRVLPGDVMCKVPFGGMFVATDVAEEQRRFDAREIVTAGPIFGRKMFAASDQAAQREQSALSAFELTMQSFNGFGKLLQGTRRHNLIYINDLAADEEPEGLRLTFTLPAGSYATVLLREVMKIDATVEEGD
ncbi:MAG: tRNA pseudouridine(13) synthase TruD [Gemmataceae bacterium]|nr:tRNA pseudouridine(13) synthase TruD [Gemmataceae bacterium]